MRINVYIEHLYTYTCIIDPRKHNNIRTPPFPPPRVLLTSALQVEAPSHCPLPSLEAEICFPHSEPESRRKVGVRSEPWIGCKDRCIGPDGFCQVTPVDADLAVYLMPSLTHTCELRGTKGQ